MKPSPAAMGPLQHLICGFLGLMFLAGFIRVMYFAFSMLFEECASLNVFELAQIFGG